MTASSSDLSRTGAAIASTAKEAAAALKGFSQYFEICRRCRVEQHCDPGDARCNLLEQLQPLASHRGLHSDETGDVSSRLREARDEAAADRIGNERENDGDGAC
jgi:hypothetical protein